MKNAAFTILYETASMAKEKGLNVKVLFLDGDIGDLNDILTRHVTDSKRSGSRCLLSIDNKLINNRGIPHVEGDKIRTIETAKTFDLADYPLGLRPNDACKLINRLVYQLDKQTTEKTEGKTTAKKTKKTTAKTAKN